MKKNILFTVVCGIALLVASCTPKVIETEEETSVDSTLMIQDSTTMVPDSTFIVE